MDILFFDASKEAEGELIKVAAAVESDTNVDRRIVFRDRELIAISCTNAGGTVDDTYIIIDLIHNREVIATARILDKLFWYARSNDGEIVMYDLDPLVALLQVASIKFGLA